MTRSVVCTGDDRKKWLKARHKYVTGSDVAVLMGMAKYPVNLTAEAKLENLKRIKKELTWEQADAEFKPTRIMNYGSIYEKWEAYLFSVFTTCTLVHTHAMLVSDELPGLACTLDALCTFDLSPFPEDIPYTRIEWPRSVSKDFEPYSWGEVSSQPLAALGSLLWGLEGVGIYEQKTSGEWPFKGSKNSPGWKTTLPEYYWCQVQLQLAITGLPWAVISCTGDRDRVAHVVYPDEFFREEVKEAAARFWL